MNYSIRKLKRVMHRLQEEIEGKEYLTKSEVRKAIMLECGVDERTFQSNYEAIKRLGWIRCLYQRYYINEVDYD